MSPKKPLKSDEEQQKYQRRPEAPPPPISHDESNWLISYADMMTLLCGFFIMLFSMAHLEEPKYDSFKKEIARQFGGEYVSSTKETALFATQLVDELALEKTAIIKSDSAGVSIIFRSTVFFESGSAELSLDGRKILKKIIDKISDRKNKNLKEYKIAIEGHTDSRPIVSGYYPSNWELSSARATRILRIFLDRGFPADQMTAIGYADTRPMTGSRTTQGKWDEEALKKNRRVVIRILEPSVHSIPLPEVDSDQNTAINTD